MLKLKWIIYLFVFISYSLIGQERNQSSKSIQIFANVGLSKPFFHSGVELLKSESIRENNESYFMNGAGERRNVGRYSSQFGWNLGIGFYKPIIKLESLLWGSEVNMNLTGSTPSAGFEEAYFFNYISMNLGLKYYLSEGNFLKLNSGVSSVMTKNRFINNIGEQAFEHQFGIGYNIQLGSGYTFWFKQNKIKGIEIELEYQFSSVRVEVNNIGNDQWQHSALALKIGFLF